MYSKIVTKVSTNIQLGVAVASLFVASGLAFASLPVNKNIGKQKNEKISVGQSVTSKILPSKTKQVTPDRIAEETVIEKTSSDKKMKKLPQTLSQLFILLDKNEKNLLALQNSKMNVPLSSQIQIQKDLKIAALNLQKLYTQGDMPSVEKNITSLKKQIVPLLLKNKKSLISQSNENENLKNLLTNQRDIIRLIELRFPFSVPELPKNFPIPSLISNSPINLRAVVCFTRWTPEAGMPNADEIREQMQTVTQSYNELFYGKVNIQLSDIVVSDIWDTAVNGTPETWYEERSMAVEMCDSVIDYSNADIVIMYPSLQQSISYGQKAAIETQEGSFDKPVAQIAEGMFLTGVLDHEIGHAAFRLLHANRVDCQEETFRENFTDCTVAEYDNIFDIMGRLDGHFGAWNKYLAGIPFGKQWIPLQVVRSDGDYNLKVLELPTLGKQLLRIPYRVHPLCLEYRKPIGIDGVLRDKLRGMAYDELESIPDDGGLVLNFCYDESNTDTGPVDLPFTQLLVDSADLLDMSPHRNNTLIDNERDNADIFLTEGNVFHNEALGVTISWQRGEDENTAQVHLDIDENRL